ncbi:fungal-specific transcription factor domain-containing protein [Aspergillus eucalypticola CBS 122712]|uniref:Fungal-specific transcription factor domain-containing protein n=1 Tax=Aspergillus eucalypticola (strain CBS 122712 / IBT 29274) TaxID=1448314 RepID=A0A317UWS0_ASPEC|nr:fungal-specific transcription factor domain-containing protein [Aspergillus eucalypticola CBS 122712]PWY65859.1 fungal-specific transcription factor domain-containing protein [Aspergillus eucalypticola CBS 122712]
MSSSSGTIAPKPRRRRDKPQFSCIACRQRKTRCDRLQPCTSCVARGHSCVYVARKPPASLLHPTPVGAPAGLHDRLVHLERLVKSLMPDGVNNDEVRQLATPDNTPSSSTRPGPGGGVLDTQSDCGSMQITDSELQYVAGEHWIAILDSIADLKAHCDREEQARLAESIEEMSVKPAHRHALLLYGCERAASRAEIIAALPPKAAIDRYISKYFNYLDLVASAVHGPSFLQEYESFWTDTTSTPIVWIGLLFSMICLAVMASDVTDSSEEEQKALQLELYREKIVQCLMIGEYTKPGPYVLETLVHYVYVEYGINPDANRNIWFLLGLEVNLAMRMGYHRDPSHFPDLSPLQGEMRRRLWTTVLTSDILLSSQMGMPRMISDWKWDTAEPRNLFDTDLTLSLTTLPPSRPETEHTTTLELIARRRMLLALGSISNLADAVQPASYAEVMQADKTLHDTVSNIIPPPLRFKPLQASMTDSSQVIMSRLFLQHLLYKGQIMLHRRFLNLTTPPAGGEPHPENPKFAYSRTACIDASLGALRIQHILDEETCRGGQLHDMHWRITSSMTHLFLTATMILCSLVHCGGPLDRGEEVLGALRTARTIWLRRGSTATSREAARAAGVVGLTLAGVGERDSIEGDGADGRVCGGDGDGDLGVGQSMGVDGVDDYVMPSILVPEDGVGLDFAFSMDDCLQMQWPDAEKFDTYSR